MQVSITCSMNWQQYKKWYQLYTLQKRGKLPYWIAFKQVSVICLIILSCMIDRMLLPCSIFVILIIQGDIIWNYHLWPWREWNKNKEYLQKQEHIQATEKGLQYAMPDHKLEYQWTGFVGFRVTPHAIYLFHQYMQHTVFPKFWFSNEQDWNDFIELISKSIQVRSTSNSNIDPKSEETNGNNP
ncbi:MAG: YcxB family protein [Phycisphaerae bacterium]|nr:YcxB family protein [Phycisphaerae bacterium]